MLRFSDRGHHRWLALPPSVGWLIRPKPTGQPAASSSFMNASRVVLSTRSLRSASDMVGLPLRWLDGRAVEDNRDADSGTDQVLAQNSATHRVVGRFSVRDAG